MERKILRSQAAGAFRNNILAGVILLFLYVLGHNGFGTDDMKGICLIWGDGFAMTGVLLLGTAGITSVSYTHLDVYKRQQEDILPDGFGQSTPSHPLRMR